MNRTSRFRVLAMTALVGAATAVSRGDTMTLTFEAMGPSRVVSATFDGTSSSVHAGRLHWNGGIRTFCTQLGEHVSLGQTLEFEVVGVQEVPDEDPAPGPMGEARAELVKDLHARWYDTVDGATGSDASDLAAAFQITLWEIVHETSGLSYDAATLVSTLSIDGGDARFSASASVSGLADQMIASLGTGGFRTFGGLRGLTHASGQDQLVVVPGVPGAGALAGLFAIARRRRRL